MPSLSGEQRHWGGGRWQGSRIEVRVQEEADAARMPRLAFAILGGESS